MSAKDNAEGSPQSGHDQRLGPWHRFIDDYAGNVPVMYSKVLATIRDDIAPLPDTHFLEVLAFVRVNGTSPLGMKRLQKRESFEKLESLGRLLKKEDPGGAMALAILAAEGSGGKPAAAQARKDVAHKPAAGSGTFKVSQICRPIEWIRL